MDDLTRIDGIGPATAKKLVAEGIDTFEKLAQANVKPEWIHEAETIVAERQNTEGKPPRPDLGAEGSAEAPALPADSGAGDPQQDNPRGSSGTAREASSTGGGTTAKTPSVGTQSGSPNLSSDTVQESMGVGDAPIAGVSDAPIGGEAEIDAGLEMLLRHYPLTLAAIRAYRAATPGRSPTLVQVTSKHDGFRRAGIAHAKGPTDYPAGSLSPDQLEQLLGEPKLKVTFE